MKNTISLIVSLITISVLFGQPPQAINYQAVIRDGSNNILSNQNIGIQIKIHTDSLSGDIVYTETHNPTTNSFGIINIIIGQGIVGLGSFSSISWQATSHFAEILVDELGGTNYQIMGGQQLMSVPYSFYADTAGYVINGVPGPVGPPGPQGAGACSDGTKDSLIALYNNATGYGYSQDGSGVGQWVTQALDNTSHNAIGSKRSLVIYSNENAYAFYRNNLGVGQWAVHPIGGTGHTAASTHDCIVLFNNSTAYAFYVDAAGSGVWIDQAIGGTVHNVVEHGNKIVVFNNGNAYSFSINDSGIGAWQVQTLGNTGHSVITTN
jgi:hypothetical protein